METYGIDWTIILFLTISIFFGTFIGMIAGALPGMGSMVAIVLLLPLTYSMSPIVSILMLLAVYQAAEYGGSISSITIGIPGTPAAAATVLDGFPYAKEKSPGKALGYSLAASTVGGLFGGIVLLLLSGPMVAFALKISDPEFFLIGILGLLAAAALSSKDKIKSLISVVLGLLAGTVGMDSFTATLRYTGGYLHLLDGLSLVAVVTGIFAFSEVFSMLSSDLKKKHKTNAKNLKVSITWKEFRQVAKPMTIGSFVGTGLGIFPGVGAGATNWLGYALAKRFSKTKESFGRGNPEGIAAPESANNATVGGAILPLLTLGIPGSAATAVMIGAFMVHGIQPGPQVMSEQPVLFNAILIGFLFTTVAMYIVGRLLTPTFAKILSVPGYIVVPAILVLSIIGVYAAYNHYFDIWIAMIFGISAYFLKKLNYSLPSFVLAFTLCPIIETSLRRTLVISDGSYSVFVTRPYSLTIMIIIVGLIGAVIYGWLKNRTKAA